MKRINLFAMLFCMALIGLMLLFPSFLTKQLGTDYAKQWLQPKQEKWTGVLRVWHIVGWQAGKGNGVTFLTSCAKSFEKEHRGVFIEIESMTPEGAADRFARGESPDVVSFPGGWGQSASFAKGLESEGIYPHLLTAGRSGNKQAALPYMMSCYMLMYNEDMLSGADIEPPSETEATGFAEICAKLTYTKKLGKKTVSYVGLELPEAFGSMPAAALLCDKPLVPGVGKYLFGSSAFKGGAAAVSVGGINDFANTDKYSFSVKFEPLSGFTDMAQYVGVWKSVNGDELPYALEFAASLTGEKAQKSLEKLYAFPVRDIEGLYDSDPAMKDLAAKCAAMRVPRAFAYAKAREELEPLSRGALDAQPGALERFREKLNAVCVG